KSDGSAFEGSNPSPSTIFQKARPCAGFSLFCLPQIPFFYKKTGGQASRQYMHALTPNLLETAVISRSGRGG
ncbi:hypothetical protein, partial [Aeromonas caviae]|uniref:hypothetical protein n=1 Tax=Aeromonas caviae TaxID=648 RepID=UPI002B4838AC